MASQIKGPTIEMLTVLPVVVRVAETESFSAAARQLGMTPSGVSKAISRLEERLGVRLFDRTTRRVTTTEEGARLYERSRQIVADVEEAQTELMETQAEPRGTVLASAPRELGQYIVSALPAFLARHPQLEVKLELTDRRVDVVGERIDLALRMGEDTSHSHGRLIRRTIGQVKAVVCAAPEYIERYGAPEQPQDLSKHNVYFYGSHREGPTRTWQFHQGEERRAVTLTGNATVDSGTALVDLARHGEGIVAVFDFLAAPAIQSGELERLLERWQVWQSQPVSLVYPRYRRLSVKVTTFANFVESVVGRAVAA